MTTIRMFTLPHCRRGKVKERGKTGEDGRIERQKIEEKGKIENQEKDREYFELQM